MTLAVIIGYLILVLSVGMFSHRLFRGTGEDYFVASRSIGPFVLLMSLFGTNMTAFAILGASGEAYRTGIGVFALMASSSAFVIPAIFLFVGTKIWHIGKRHGYLTQIQFFRDRWQSDGLGLLLFVVLVGLLVPYLLIGVVGAGLTFAQITSGQIPAWAGSLLVCFVICFYVTFSGMRGTAWVNTFQTLVFMSLGAITFFVILGQMGGMTEAVNSVGEVRPDLLVLGEHITPLKLLTYTCIPLSAGMFPHIFSHWLTAGKVENFKFSIVCYPICMAIVWIPSVLLGISGVLDFPDLQGPAGNSVLVKLVDLHAQGILGGLLAAGIFAAIMSSLDSQVLSLGNIFTQDIVRHYRFRDTMSEKQQVWWGRLFVLAILGLTFALSFHPSSRSIFKLAVWSFTGFASLFPIVVAALYWKRSTKTGAFAAVITVVVCWIYFFSKGSPVLGASGIMVVAVMLLLSISALVIGSLLSKPPAPEIIEKFFPERPQ